MDFMAVALSLYIVKVLAPTIVVLAPPMDLALLQLPDPEP
jgi:hypothetical protein